MAHQINYNEQTGRHSFFSVKEKAWHGLGQVVTDYPNSREALQFAGLDFEVIKRPNIHRLDNGEEVISETSFFTSRTDNNSILGDKLGADYEVVQNVDAFAFFDAIVGGDGIQYETAGALGKGERIFITAKLPGYIRVGSDDLIDKLFVPYHFARWFRQHNGGVYTDKDSLRQHLVRSNTQQIKHI